VVVVGATSTGSRGAIAIGGFGLFQKQPVSGIGIIATTSAMTVRFQRHLRRKDFTD
jgi:hypothetical protein